MLSSLPDADVAGFACVRSGGHGGVHVLPDALPLSACAALVRSFERGRHLAPTFGAPHEHFSGRTLAVDRMDPAAATLARAFSQRMAAALQALLGEPDGLVDDTPQVAVWPAPHGMYWHQDTWPAHRRYTAMAYLSASSDLVGGETGFRSQRLLVPPQPGTAVLFAATQWHGVHDVRSGVRHALTCWYGHAAA